MRKSSLPQTFGADFLAWFKERTEAHWSAIPAQSLEEVLGRSVQRRVGGCSWQASTHWLDGLSEVEIEAVEARWHLTFPANYRLFLRMLHAPDRPRWCTHYLDNEMTLAASALATAEVKSRGQMMGLFEKPSFYNWESDNSAIQSQYAWLWEGLQFDLEYASLWLPSWGPKPSDLDIAKAHVRKLVEAAPKLIPVIGHRYLLADPTIELHPIISIYQSDIIVYGASLYHYLTDEFANILGLTSEEKLVLRAESNAEINKHYEAISAIPFWGELLNT